MTLCGNHFALTILFRSEFLVIFTQSNQTFGVFLGRMERTADSFESIKGPNQNCEDARWSRLIATLVKKRQIKRIHFSTCSQWTRVAEVSIGKTEWYFQQGKFSENLICSERFLSGHDCVLSVVCQHVEELHPCPIYIYFSFPIDFESLACFLLEHAIFLLLAVKIIRPVDHQQIGRASCRERV